ncbi:MAG: ClpXP protease specificity-enhancing factor [Janthinobacterium lividum]
MADTSTKPYLIRALHEWCSENGFTPHLAVRVDASTRVPKNFVRNGEIVLNVSYDATNQLKLGNDFIEFTARFSGQAFPIEVPVENVLAIYARENGQGMAFPVDEGSAAGAQGSEASTDVETAGEASDVPGGAAPKEVESDLRSDVPATPAEGASKPSRPHLKVIK